jgi:hypothetical protein
LRRKVLSLKSLRVIAVDRLTVRIKMAFHGWVAANRLVVTGMRGRFRKLAGFAGLARRGES